MRSPQTPNQPVPHAPANARRRTRHRALVATAIFGMTVMGGYFGWAWQIHEERQEGLRLAGAARFAQAEPLLQAALGRRPDDIAVLRALALSRLAAKQPEEAESYLTRWIDLLPNDREALDQRLRLRVEWKRFPEAIEDARRILRLEPGAVALRESLVNWLVNIGSYDDAEGECLRCEEQKPGDLNLLFLRAQIRHRKGDAAAAASLSEQVLRKAPRSRLVLQFRAILFLEDNRPEKAVPLLREVLAASKEHNQVARYYLILALSQTGQTEEAHRVQAEMTADEAAALWAERGREANPGLLLRAAESLLAVGKSEEAIRLLDKVLEQDSHCPAAHRLLADYYEKQGQTAKAAEHKRKAQ